MLTSSQGEGMFDGLWRWPVAVRPRGGTLRPRHGEGVNSVNMVVSVIVCMAYQVAVSQRYP